MHDFHNPETPGGAGNGSGNIEGPDVLCPGETKHYKLISGYPNSTLSDILWSSTTNMTVFSPAIQETDVKLNANANPTYLQVNFQENRAISQFYEGEQGGRHH
jgi:hypothetical protein